LKNPNVSTVITGASRPEQVVDNFGALQVVERLSESIMKDIEGVLRNKPRPEMTYRM